MSLPRPAGASVRAACVLFALTTTALSYRGTAASAADVPPPTTAPAAATPAPKRTFSPVVPDGLGVNIHFTDPKPGEMRQLAAAGFGIVRMDLTWAGTERKAGAYDFAAYDRLLAALDAHKVRALFILDYGNKLYDDGLSPHTDAGRAAFAKWAAAAASHFKGRGVLWEIWNEPNHANFWKPKANVDDYVKLALIASKAIHEAAPSEIVIGPATSEVDLPFLEACFKAGLLEHWSAVSVHPYRQTNPETAADDYRKLRRLIARYAPKGKQVPILSGEWGYSVAWKNFDEATQGKYLPRQWLTNLANDVPVSIWYDWHDDGANPAEAEHNFGTVKHAYHKDRGDAPYDAKPAYVAARTLTTSLNGYRFNKRLAVGDEASDFVLLFDKADEPTSPPVPDLKLVVWTASKEPRSLLIPASPGSFRAVDHLGKDLPPIATDTEGLHVTATDGPQYLTPEKPNDLLRVAAAWDRAPLDLVLTGGQTNWVMLDVQNPLPEPFRAIGATTGGFEPRFLPVPAGGSETIPAKAVLMRDVEWQALPVRVSIGNNAVPLAQWTHATVSNPMRVVPLPVGGNVLPLRVENPTGEPFEGRVYVTDVEGEIRIPPKRFELDEGERLKVLEVPFDRAGKTGPYRLGLRVEDRDNNIAIKQPPTRYQPVDDFARFKPGAAVDGWKVVADGDAKVASEQSLAAAPPEGGPVAPNAGTLQLKYKFDAGHKFLSVLPDGPKADDVRRLDGEPKSFGVWVHGDGQGHAARMRFVDATGQVFQPDFGRVTWTGWRYVTVPLDGTKAGFWGGAKDGKVHHPIKLDTPFLLDNAGRQASHGTVYVAGPVVVY